VEFRTGPTAAFTDTTDTAANIVAGIPANASVGQSWTWEYINQTAYPCTLAAGTGVTLSGTCVVPPFMKGSFLVQVTAVGATPTVTITQKAVNNICDLPPAQYNTLNATTGTLAAGLASGAAVTVIKSSNAVPGAQAMRTVAQVIADIPGGYVGMKWLLRIVNTGAGTLTLATDGSAQWTMTGTMTVAQNTFRDFVCQITGATTGTVTEIGTGTDS
jgi:hypothetical protein